MAAQTYHLPPIPNPPQPPVYIQSMPHQEPAKSTWNKGGECRDNDDITSSCRGRGRFGHGYHSCGRWQISKVNTFVDITVMRQIAETTYLDNLFASF